jgi:glutaredoxin-like protein
MHNIEGQAVPVPQVIFKTRSNDKFKNVSSEDIFQGRTVFSLPGDPFEVSDADTLFEYINPNAVKPKAVSIITKPGCPFCAKAKDILEAQGLDYEEIVLGDDAGLHSLRAISGSETVPQVFVEGQIIGGSEALQNWLDQADHRAA